MSCNNFNPTCAKTDCCACVDLDVRPAEKQVPSGSAPGSIAECLSVEEFIYSDSGWIEDKHGNIICQFWGKDEEDFCDAKRNAQRIADLLNSYGLE